MKKGILYVMSTAVHGLIKIGKTETRNFENRMYTLERNGYCNVAGLRRQFAIEVDDYSEKEALLDRIFSKSQVPGSELFALDLNLAIQLLTSFEGRVVYPQTETKEELYNDAADKSGVTPDGSKKRKSAAKFRFSMVGLSQGDTLEYKKDPSVRVTVADDTHVTYKGEAWSMSALAAKLSGISPVQGTAYFTYKGELLTAMRLRLQEGGKAKKGSGKSPE